MNVMLVTADDDVTKKVATLMEIYFPTWTLDVYTSREVAYLKALSSPPDLCIADLDLKEPNFEETRQARISSLVMVHVSSKDESSYHGSWSVEVGALEYLHKPLDVAQLATIFHICSKPRKSRAS